MNRLLTILISAAIGLFALVPAADAAFTYQGYLDDNGQPASGPYDFEFRLFTGEWPFGFIVGSPVVVDDLQVVDGYFTVKLDFGNPFPNGGARWLDISVRPGASTGSYTILSPRQELTPAPYASALMLPYAVSINNSSPLFALTQTGPGATMTLQNTGNGDALDVSASVGDAVYAHSTGTGAGVYAQTGGSGNAIHAHSSSGAHAVYGQTNGGGTAVYGYNLGTAGRAGFFRTESTANPANALETQANGTGHALKANARVGSAGLFENTNASNISANLRSETNGTGLALWSRTTGSSSAARIEIANSNNSNPALDVRTNGNGLAAKFTGGDVRVDGRLYAQVGTVLNRATPIAWGRFKEDGTLLSSSGNVTITAQADGTWQVFVVGEGEPWTWTTITTIDYEYADTNLEYVAKVSRPLAVPGQPGNGVIIISDQCKNGCDEFQIFHYINFVIYKGN